MQFLAVEPHGTALEATFTQFLRHAVEDTQFGSIITVLALQNLLHLFVGIAAVALDHGMSQVPVVDVGFFIQNEDDAVTELLLVGAQRTDVVAEPLRQHGNGAVDEIDAGTLLGLLVDDAALGDVVRHVGDMYTDLPQIQGYGGTGVRG